MRKLDKILSCVRFLTRRIKIYPKIGEPTQSAGLLLGSGWESILDKDFIIDSRLSYSAIPHFLRPSVTGHKGELIICRLKPACPSADRQIPLLILSGRVHYYEGYRIEDIVFPIRVLAALGIRQLIITNAAGAINPKFRVGDLMLITDQINFQFKPQIDIPIRSGLRCRSADLHRLNGLYNRGLIKLSESVARRLGIRLRKGVYVGVTGPNFETPAEIKMFRKFGADAVGMSTVAETSVAAHLGMKVLGISCLVNQAAGLNKKPLGHMDVLQTVQRIKKPLGRLIKSIIAPLHNKE